MGVTGNSLEHLSDLDLFVAIGMVAEHLAADGNADAAADTGAPRRSRRPRRGLSTSDPMLPAPAA